MEIQPSLLSYIFAGSTKWCINYEFPELTLELDGAIVKLGGVSKSMLKKSRLNFDKIEKCK